MTNDELLINSINLKGLTQEQVQQKTINEKSDRLTEDKFKAVKIFFKQFLDIFCVMLVIASIISIIYKEYSDAIVILSIVFINCILGFIQEYKCEKTITKLKMHIRQKVLVLRENKKIYIDSSGLLTNDIIILKGGEKVPADIKIIRCTNLCVDESQFTGESDYVYKKENESIYCGSIIKKGYCIGIVTAIGKNAEIGKVFKSTKTIVKKSEYQKSLKKFSIFMLKLVGVSIVLMVVIKAIFVSDKSLILDSILFAVALSLTVLPEALPMIVTINFATCCKTLAKQNVIVKRLDAIESLARINILCTDKTGTITQDKLNLVKVFTNNKELFDEFVCASIEDYNNNIIDNISAFDKILLENASEKAKINSKNYLQVDTLPFDPDDRRRRVIVKNINTNEYYLIVLGDVDELNSLSSDDKEIYNRYEIEKNKYSGKRLYGVYFKKLDINSLDIISNENNLIPLGITVFEDSLRVGAKKTLAKAKELGLDIKIISGDNKAVVENIASQAGLLNSQVYTGQELEELSSDEFIKVCKECSAFAKITPQLKSKIILTLKKENSVAYMGDGINDAIALKSADVSIAVHNASDIAKDCADIVLLDDSLDKIIDSILIGRASHQNINKYIKHAMIGNIGNFFSLVLFYLIFASDLPMLPVQLLIANLIQDMPLIIIAKDNVDLESLKTVSKQNSIQSTVKTSLILGIMTSIFYFVYFIVIGVNGDEITRTILFLFFNITQITIILAIRKKESLFSRINKPSKALIFSIVLFIAISFALVYVPALANLLGFSKLSIVKVLQVSLVSIIFIVFIDLCKLVLVKLKFKF